MQWTGLWEDLRDKIEEASVLGLLFIKKTFPGEERISGFFFSFFPFTIIFAEWEKSPSNMLFFLFSFFSFLKYICRRRGNLSTKFLFLYLDICMREERPFRRIRILFSLNNICRRVEYPKHQVSYVLLKSIYKRREDPKHQVSFFSICNRREEPVYQASICHQACVHCPMCILVHALLLLHQFRKHFLLTAWISRFFFVKFCFQSWEPYVLSQKS